MSTRQCVVASVVVVVSALSPVADAAPQFANIPATTPIVVGDGAYDTPEVAVTGAAFDVRWNAIVGGSAVTDISLCGSEIGSKSKAVREPNTVVSIGARDDDVPREYFAVTNNTGQLVEVIAREIIVQDDGAETVTDKGRYCDRMPYVPAAGKGFDRGHVIADSLGGESNLYNLTPQQSALNRHGDQAFIEDQIRKAGGAQDFHAVITYPDAQADVPTQYSIAYAIDGVSQVRTFANMDPEATTGGAVVTQPGDDDYVLPGMNVTDTPEVTNTAPETAQPDSTSSSSDEDVSMAHSIKVVLALLGLLGLAGAGAVWLFGRGF